MNDHRSTSVSGVVRDVFAHRFVLRTEAGSLLADLGPRGAEAIRLAVGDAITVTGEQKPSELKVFSVERDGHTVEVVHGKPHAEADPNIGRRAAEMAGLAVLGEPRRKPKHVEVLGRDTAGKLIELHVELDGHVRKRKEVDGSVEKWAGALSGLNPP